MTQTRATEMEPLRAELEQLKALMTGGESSKFCIPDPIKNLSEFTGSKKELGSWLREVDELYDMFKIKGTNGQPDSISSMYLRAIKNKVKGDARAILCANGDPDTISGIKQILVEQYGDQSDFATNVSALFNIRRGDKGHLRFYNECKDLNTRLKANLTSHPITGREIIDVLSVTRYLDNIGEPLAAIIRQSKPKTLEEAYESVCINQNAETRVKPAKASFKQQSHPGSSNSSHANSFHRGNANAKPSYKYPLQKNKPRVEHHINEVDVDGGGDDDDDDNDVQIGEEQNFREESDGQEET